MNTNLGRSLSYRQNPFAVNVKKQPSKQLLTVRLREGVRAMPATQSLTSIADRVLPKSMPFAGGEQAVVSKLISGLPKKLADQLKGDNIYRTIKYITWGAPTLFFPAMTYFSTKDKDEAGENFYRDAAHYAPGPVIQLGGDALIMGALSRFMPKAFENKSQAELLSFTIAYIAYSFWVTFGVQKAMEASQAKSKGNPHTQAFHNFKDAPRSML